MRDGGSQNDYGTSKDGEEQLAAGYVLKTEPVELVSTPDAKKAK